ncbi:hypothetical protein BKA83DRAFT_25137 [Pisolithus microcarpus]|nr:hypothetical protein BKA83DRAFT_25137 [Pisolithus microcarpus]
MYIDWTDQGLEDYGVKMPPMATENEVQMGWGDKQGADLEPLKKIGAFKQTDKQMANMECIASAKVRRKEEKDSKEVEKATLFVPRDREKKEAEEKANCQVAYFDKRMQEEEQQQQQALSAGPSKRTGENLRSLKFNKVKRGGRSAKSSGLLKQTLLNTWVIYVEEDGSGAMDVEVHYTKEELQEIHQIAKGFVSTEATLSCGNPSSDESEDPEDGYDPKFIDDSAQMGRESSVENESKATAKATDSSDDSDKDIDGSKEGDEESMEDISQFPKNDGNGGKELTEDTDTSSDSSALAKS